MALFAIFFGWVRECPSFLDAFSFDESDSSLFLTMVMFIQYYCSVIDPFLRIGINLYLKKHEHEADAYAVEQGFGKELESSLIGLAAADLGLIFESDVDTLLNSTHPSLLNRLEAIDYEVSKLHVKNK